MIRHWFLPREWFGVTPASTTRIERIRILSGAHANHFGDLVRVHRGKALVRLRDGACVWVEDGEWVRVSQ
jgi:hypothetical protein